MNKIIKAKSKKKNVQFSLWKTERKKKLLKETNYHTVNKKEMDIF